MKTMITQITECIEKTFDINGTDLSRKIIIFPCGDIGIQAVNILKDIYAIEPAAILDNNKCKYSERIKPSSFLETIDTKEYVLLLSSTNPDVYLSLRKMVLPFFSADRLLELECMRTRMRERPYSLIRTKIGKYSYGPICRNHMYIESIGAFCSFGQGVDAVPNHEMRFLTTHPMIAQGMNQTDMEIDYEFFKESPYYFPGVRPKPLVAKRKRSVIGNDVWLGDNVLITNGADIGNGAIVGAGAVITKDIPDYAVAVGVPARVIRYRYDPAQIEALNRIAWWNWSDEKIRANYDDLYIPVDEFIEKHGR